MGINLDKGTLRSLDGRVNVICTPASFCRSLALASLRNRRTEMIAPLPGRPYIFSYFTPRPNAELQVRQCGTGKVNPASVLFGVLAVCDENRTEVLKHANFLQWLTVKKEGLALLTKNEC